MTERNDMRYQIDGDDLCIRISLDVISQSVGSRATVLDHKALAVAVGRKLYDDLDDAIEHVVLSEDPSLSFPARRQRRRHEK